jgi:hypothetical protein
MQFLTTNPLKSYELPNIAKLYGNKPAQDRMAAILENVRQKRASAIAMDAAYCHFLAAKTLLEAMNLLLQAQAIAQKPRSKAALAKMVQGIFREIDACLAKETETPEMHQLKAMAFDLLGMKKEAEASRKSSSLLETEAGSTPSIAAGIVLMRLHRQFQELKFNGADVQELTETMQEIGKIAQGLKQEMPDLQIGFGES